MQFYYISDLLVVPLWLIILFSVAYIVRIRNVDKPEYDFFIFGLLAKIIGAIVFVLIYTLYYNGGDTTAYFESSTCLVRLFFKKPEVFFSILSNNLSPENFFAFDRDTGWPGYWRDPQSFAVVRFTAPFALLGFHSFFATTLIVAALTYTGLWKLYLLFNKQYPKLKFQFAIAILFVPSVIFWGSGILKDSFTLSAACWLIYGIYKIVVEKKNFIFYIITSIISIYILLSIKPYIFFAVFLGAIMWMAFEKLNVFKGAVLRTVFFPVFMVLFGAIGAVVIIRVSEVVGGYYASVEGILEKAVVTQQDLRRDYYGENSFDIGDYDPSLIGIASKAPQALTAGLFRPFIWEARSFVMLISGLENLFLLLFTLKIIFLVGPGFVLKCLIEKPFLLIFSFAFTLTFAFAIGVTTANFGALVRYKIPLVPFFLSGLFIINYKYKLAKKRKEFEKRELYA